MANSSSTTPAPLQLAAGTVLTVGAGMEFATLGDACRAATAGDTIAVQAGTYTNDFATVTCGLKIVAVGGMVNEVATVPPPNDKAILTVDASLTLQGFSFTGGSDGSPDGNVAGIRLENGSLAVSYCYFHDMQEGLLAGVNQTGIVTIDHSEFARNGTGDGYTHNIYVGSVASLTITNSLFTGANVGHEIKSRAASTTISNNVIVDGAGGTASYDIDIPNAGVASITNNLIEKGASASNIYAIHYGGETQFAFAKNALTVSGNTILNDLGSQAWAVYNQSAANGLNVTASVTRNSLYGFDPAHVLQGAGTLAGNTRLAAEPGYSLAPPFGALPALALAPGPQLLNLVNSGHVVSGGVGRLTVNDAAGNNTIQGGAGGVNVTAPAGWDLITTQANASSAITIGGRNTTVQSAGADHIAVPGYYQEVDATGQATITGSAFNTYRLGGAGERLTASGGGNVFVGAAGNANVIDVGGDFSLTVAAGGRAVISDQAAAAPPNDGSATVTGAASGWIGNSGAVSLTTGAAGTSVLAGNGSVSVVSGGGADTLVAGAGNDVFTLGAGADRVGFGSGSATVSAGSGLDTYVFQAGQHGTDVINGFRPGQDSMIFRGFTGSAIASSATGGGNTVMTLTDGTVVTFIGVTLQSMGTMAATAGGNQTLTGGTGHDSISGASLHSVLNLAASDTMSLGAGMMTVHGGAATLFVVPPGAAGSLVVTAWSPDDHIVSPGQVAAQSVSGGSDWLHFASGAQIELVGVPHFV